MGQHLHRDVAAIGALICLPFNIANAIAFYMGYSPLGKIDSLGGTPQRVGAAVISATVLLALFLTILLILLKQITRHPSDAIQFALSVLALLLGGAILATLLFVLVSPVLSVPGGQRWLGGTIITAICLWLLAGVMFWCGVNETQSA